MTMTSPLRGPKSAEGGGFAAAHLLARRAGYGAAPPAPRVLRIALRATALRAAPDPAATAAPGGRNSGAGPGLRSHERGTKPPRGQARSPLSPVLRDVSDVEVVAADEVRGTVAVEGDAVLRLDRQGLLW